MFSQFGRTRPNYGESNYRESTVLRAMYPDVILLRPFGWCSSTKAGEVEKVLIAPFFTTLLDYLALYLVMNHKIEQLKRIKCISWLDLI